MHTEEKKRRDLLIDWSKWEYVFIVHLATKNFCSRSRGIFILINWGYAVFTTCWKIVTQFFKKVLLSQQKENTKSHISNDIIHCIQHSPYWFKFAINSGRVNNYKVFIIGSAEPSLWIATSKMDESMSLSHGSCL